MKFNKHFVTLELFGKWPLYFLNKCQTGKVHFRKSSAVKNKITVCPGSIVTQPKILNRTILSNLI